MKHLQNSRSKCLTWIPPIKITINLEAIAKAATVVARTALAAAYGNADDASAVDTIAELDADDETLTALAKCLLENGNCKLLSNYAKMERVNDGSEYDTDLEIGPSLGNPPSYYPGLFDIRNGPPFVQYSWTKRLMERIMGITTEIILTTSF